MTKIIPGAMAPEMKQNLLSGGTWSPGDDALKAFTLLEVYRGIHCPICAQHLAVLNAMAGEFAVRNVRLITFSMDNEEKAARAKADWTLDAIDVGYGLDEQTARNWGLYISQSIKESEPGIFCEPGTFLVRGDGSIYMANVSTAPFLRPQLARILRAVDMATENNYPPRGTLA